MSGQHLRGKRGQLASSRDAKQLQFLVGLGANAVDFSALQGPDFCLQVFVIDNRNAVGLVELAGHFGQQFVGRHTDRAGQTGCGSDGFLNQPRQHPAPFALAARYFGKVNVDLINATVFHQWRNL